MTQPAPVLYCARITDSDEIEYVAETKTFPGAERYVHAPLEKETEMIEDVPLKIKRAIIKTQSAQIDAQAETIATLTEENRQWRIAELETELRLRKRDTEQLMELGKQMPTEERLIAYYRMATAYPGETAMMIWNMVTQ